MKREIIYKRRLFSKKEGKARQKYLLVMRKMEKTQYEISLLKMIDGLYEEWVNVVVSTQFDLNEMNWDEVSCHLFHLVHRQQRG